MTWAYWIVGIATVYAASGFLLAVAFALRGAGTIDPAAEHSGWGFRLLIVPGAAALWPLLAKRWWLR